MADILGILPSATDAAPSSALHKPSTPIFNVGGTGPYAEEACYCLFLCNLHRVTLDNTGKRTQSAVAGNAAEPEPLEDSYGAIYTNE